jgi:predicted transposase YbfD/YdcC
VIGGAEGWEDMENYGIAKQQWLKEFLELDNGIPSDDTFRRVAD